MRFAKAALLIFLCSCSSAVPSVEQAGAYNLALAPLLLGAQNACNAPVRTPSEENIFSVADARIVALVPQVGNTTSDLANASLIWGWSASFPQQARFPVREDERCPAGEIIYFSPSAPSFSGELSYRYGNSTETVQLSSHSPSPVPLSLGAGKLAEADFAAPLANLSISLDGTISVSYSFSKSAYSYGCSGSNGYSWCGCSLGSAQGTRAFSTPLSHARNFLVETGPVSALWLNPPLQSRLSGSGEGKLVFFARRLPASISFSFAGREIANSSLYLFSTRTGQCGEQAVEREFVPSGSAFANSSAPIFPSQLVEKNASYFPFYVQFNWSAQPGRSEFAILLEDAFSSQEKFARNFSVRQVTQLPSAGQPAAFGPLSGPAAGPSGAMGQHPADDDSTGAAYPSQQKQAAYPDFSLLAAAFALPLAIGAAALCRRLEWL